MQLRFTKMHGLGNDFVVIDATRAPFAADPEQLRQLADRRFGVGCDQILVLEPPAAPDVDFSLRIFNADGSETGQCGNGARSIGRFVRAQGLSAKSDLRLRTRSSLLEVKLLDDGGIRVDMGVPRLQPAEIPFAVPARAPSYTLTLHGGDPVQIGAVNMGNPHAVLEVPDVQHAPVAALGAELERHPAFPERVNVGFMQVMDRRHLALRVFERGVGETLACGSGACAAVVIGQLWGKLDEQVTVALPGGELLLEWRGEGRPVFMTGPAERVYEGEIEWGNR